MDIVVITNVFVAGLRSQKGASNALLHKTHDGKKACFASLDGCRFGV